MWPGAVKQGGRVLPLPGCSPSADECIHMPRRIALWQKINHKPHPESPTHARERSSAPTALHLHAIHVVAKRFEGREGLNLGGEKAAGI